MKSCRVGIVGVGRFGRLHLARIPGIQVAACGPGNIEQAHSNEEWISREQIHAAYRMYLRAAARLCLPKE
jgi:acetylornithine deacetylase/succinyl-diaminopimelate desuccinylase-like protein